jgi:allantoin racemase
MRLWYQSFARVTEFGAYSAALRGSLDVAADPETHIEFHGIEKGGGVADQYRYIEYLDTREVIENAMRAQREGFDAFLLGNIADPGLAEIREVLDIPALGLCQTSLHLACMMGRRYGMITINPKFTPRIAENVRFYGLTEQLAGIRLMQVPKLTSLGAAFSEARAMEEVREQFAQAARECIADGAEVLIPAGGVVMALLSAHGIRDIDGVPILDGVPALVMMGEMAVKLRGILGGFTSKALSYAPPSGEVLEEIRRFYGADAYR